jgi:hypothetical protein
MKARPPANYWRACAVLEHEKILLTRGKSQVWHMSEQVLILDCSGLDLSL